MARSRSVTAGQSVLGRFEAAHARHLDVHEQHVGALALEQRHGFLAVMALARHDDVGLGGEDGGERRGDERVVVHDAHAERLGGGRFAHAGSPFGTVANTLKPRS